MVLFDKNPESDRIWLKIEIDRLRVARPLISSRANSQIENQIEGQRNNVGRHFDEVSTLIETAITYINSDHVIECGPKVLIPRELEPKAW